MKNVNEPPTLSHGPITIYENHFLDTNVVPGDATVADKVLNPGSLLQDMADDPDGEKSDITFTLMDIYYDKEKDFNSTQRTHPAGLFGIDLEDGDSTGKIYLSQTLDYETICSPLQCNGISSANIILTIEASDKFDKSSAGPGKASPQT